MPRFDPRVALADVDSVFTTPTKFLLVHRANNFKRLVGQWKSQKSNFKLPLPTEYQLAKLCLKNVVLASV